MGKEEMQRRGGGGEGSSQRGGRGRRDGEWRGGGGKMEELVDPEAAWSSAICVTTGQSLLSVSPFPFAGLPCKCTRVQ